MNGTHTSLIKPTRKCLDCQSEIEETLKFCDQCGAPRKSRYYEVDAVRSAALILLITYHIIVSFDTGMRELGFIVHSSDGAVQIIQLLSQALNIWRIPILFVTAGMAVSFSLERRTMGAFIKERSRRLILPLIFGSLTLVPLGLVISNFYYGKTLEYIPNPGYLWFVVDIVVIIFLLIPLFIYIKNRPDGIILKFMRRLFNIPGGVIIVFALPMMLVAGIINTECYPCFFNFVLIDNPHGTLIAVVCILMGFIFIRSGIRFWNSVRKLKYICLLMAIVLYILRMVILSPTWDEGNARLPLLVINLLTAFESVNWMLAALGLASAFLNKRKKLLTYMTNAVYPMYMVHLPLQFYLSTLIFALPVAPFGKLVVLVILNVGACLISYEVIKRIRWVRVLFGMKP